MTSRIKNVVYVVEITSKGNLRLPSIYNKPPLNFYNVEIEFKENNQTLKML